MCLRGLRATARLPFLPALAVGIDLRREDRAHRHGAGEFRLLEPEFLRELRAAGVRADTRLTAVENHGRLRFALELVVMLLFRELLGREVRRVERERLAGREQKSVSRHRMHVRPAASPVRGILLREDVGLVVLRHGRTEFVEPRRQPLVRIALHRPIAEVGHLLRALRHRQTHAEAREEHPLSAAAVPLVPVLDLAHLHVKVDLQPHAGPDRVDHVRMKDRVVRRASHRDLRDHDGLLGRRFGELAGIALDLRFVEALSLPAPPHVPVVVGRRAPELGDDGLRDEVLAVVDDVLHHAACPADRVDRLAGGDGDRTAADLGLHRIERGGSLINRDGVLIDELRDADLVADRRPFRRDLLTEGEIHRHDAARRKLVEEGEFFASFRFDGEVRGDARHQDAAVTLHRPRHGQIVEVLEIAAGADPVGAGLHFRDLGGHDRLLQFLEAGMRTAVGIDQPVDAEVAVVRGVAEVAAVGEGRAAVPVPDGDGVVDEFPDAAAEEFVVALDDLPVRAEVSGAVAHRVGVFAEEERLIELRVLTVFRAPLRRRVHVALHVRHVARVFAVVVSGVRAFVMHEAGGVAGLDPRGHRGVVAAEAGFVAEGPEDHRRMVLVALDHALGTVDVRLFPRRIVGEAVPRMHAVGLDVGLVADIEAVSVTQLGEAGIVRIVRGADHVDVVRLHDHEVALHVLHGGRVAEEVMAVVAVHALGLDLLAVDEDALVSDLDPARADGQGDVLAAAGEVQGVEIRLLVAPEHRVLDGGDLDRAFSVHGELAGGQRLPARAVELPRDVRLAGEGELCLEAGGPKVVAQIALDEDVAHMHGIAEEEEDLAEDAGHAPHILVLEVGAVGPFEDEDLEGVLPLVDQPGDVDLGGEVGDLRIGGEGVVDPDVERGVDALEVQIGLLRLHRGRDREVADIERAGVLVRDERRIDRDRVVHVRVVRDVIPAAEGHLPAHGDGHAFEAFGREVRARHIAAADVLDGLEEAERPLAVEGLEEGGFPAVLVRGVALGGERNEVRAGRFASDVQGLRILVIIGKMQRHIGVLLYVLVEFAGKSYASL